MFKKWGVVDEFPRECRKVAYGMDFGYSHDPTAIVKCGIVGDRLYLQEVCYKTEMLASDIIKELRSVHAGEYAAKVISDSADPRLIQEIANGASSSTPSSKAAAA